MKKKPTIKKINTKTDVMVQKSEHDELRSKFISQLYEDEEYEDQKRNWP